MNAALKMLGRYTFYVCRFKKVSLFVMRGDASRCKMLVLQS